MNVHRGGCVSCWQVAAWYTRMYTRRDGQPVTTVGLYRERHAAHMDRVARGESPSHRDAGVPPAGAHRCSNLTNRP